MERFLKMSSVKETQSAFEAAKKAVASAAKLAHPKPAAVFVLSTDASDNHVGGVLQQQVGKKCQTLAFFAELMADLCYVPGKKHLHPLPLHHLHFHPQHLHL
jgi:RNase H-like domain found in reverse transcriptase